MADHQGADDEPRGRVPGQRDPQPPASAPAQGAVPNREIGIEINPRQLRVVPGQPETATISLRYHGNLVTELALRLSGEAAYWTRVVPDVINVFPDTEAQATLRFDPPRASSPAAGLVELVVSVETRGDASAPAFIRRPIEIAPFDGLAAAAGGPTNVANAREAVVPIKVRNTGNRTANVAVRSSDPGSLDFEIAPAQFDLQPGAETTTWITVRPKQALQSGPSLVHPFTIFVSSDRSATVTVDGRFEQLPVPPPAPPALPTLPPAWRAPAPAQPPKKGSSGLVAALLVLALVVAGGAAGAYALGVFKPKPTEGPTNGPTSGPTQQTQAAQGGGPDINGTWVGGDIRPGPDQQFAGTLVLGDLNVTSGGNATWSVQLFGQPFYTVGCAGGYDRSSSTVVAKEASMQQGDADATGKALSAAFCGWDMDSSSGQAFGVAVDTGFPVSLTLSLGGAELEWKKGL